MQNYMMPFSSNDHPLCSIPDHTNICFCFAHWFNHETFCPSKNSNINFFQALCYTSMQNCRHYISFMYRPFQFYTKHPFMQQLTTFSKLSPPTFCSGSHSILASSTCTHPCYLYIYINSFSHDFSSCSSTSPVFHSHFQQATIRQDFIVTLFTPAHPLWDHLPHCAHTTELVFMLLSRRQHMGRLYS